MHGRAHRRCAIVWTRTGGKPGPGGAAPRLPRDLSGPIAAPDPDARNAGPAVGARPLPIATPGLDARGAGAVQERKRENELTGGTAMWRRFIAAAVAGSLLAGALGAGAQTPSGLPADVDPETYSRLKALDREDLGAEGRRAWDLVVGDGPKPTTGPALVSMYSPKVAEAFHILNQHLRYGGELAPRQFEVAILAATWEIEQQYEWSAHEPAAVRAGVPQVVVDTIKYDRPLEGLGDEDTLIIEVARSLLRDHELDSALYAKAVAHFGERGFVELVTIMGDYIMAGILLTAIDQHQPPGRPALLPER